MDPCTLRASWGTWGARGYVVSPDSPRFLQQRLVVVLALGRDTACPLPCLLSLFPAGGTLPELAGVGHTGVLAGFEVRELGGNCRSRNRRGLRNCSITEGVLGVALIRSSQPGSDL